MQCTQLRTLEQFSSFTSATTISNRNVLMYDGYASQQVLLDAYTGETSTVASFDEEKLMIAWLATSMQAFVIFERAIYVFEMSTKQWRVVEPRHSPEEYFGALLVFQEQKQRLWFFGGKNVRNQFGHVAYIDTATLEEWVVFPAQFERMVHAGVYVPSTQCIFLHGGRQDEDVRSDMFHFDTQSFIMTEYDYYGARMPRKNHVMVLHPDQHSLLSFAGETNNANMVAQVDEFFIHARVWKSYSIVNFIPCIAPYIVMSTVTCCAYLQGGYFANTNETGTCNEKLIRFDLQRSMLHQLFLNRGAFCDLVLVF